MEEIVLDIETDGLLDTVTKVHLLVYRNLSTGDLTVADSNESISKALETLKDKKIVGHNVLGFDLIVLNKLFGFNVPIDHVIDTLILSRLIYPNIREEDSKLRKIEAKLWGSHSLKAWGERLGSFKGTYNQQEDAFVELTPEMRDYCINDVHLTESLYEFFRPDIPSKSSAKLEHEITDICIRQENRGFSFDESKATELYVELSKKRSKLSQKLGEVFGSWIVDEGLRKNDTYSKISIVNFNPNSRKHIAKRLQELRGWTPTIFTPSGEAKIDEKVLSKLKYPEAKLMSEYFMLNKRIAQLAEGNQAWMKLCKKGRLHGKVNTMGAQTSRCSHSHPNIAQVPNLNAPYGKECRNLFKADTEMDLLGIDVSSLELRCLSHYLARYDNGEYGKILLESDIHTANQRSAGLATRDQAKTFIYGFLYGAGNEKIGQIVGKGKAEGAKLKKEFLSKIPALRQLRDAVQKKAEKGFITGLDGRKVPVRSNHAALNTLLQSAGAIICKRWIVEMHSLLKEEFKEGEDYAQVAFVHDEVQLTVKREYGTRIGELGVKAISITGEKYGLRIPLTGEFKTGASWADTH
mgnify:CR=1 FL=1